MQARVVFFIIVAAFYHAMGFSDSRSFQKITNQNGLSQSEVYSFLEDSKGFMWIGTLYGLNRFDGYDVTVYTTDRFNPNSIPNNTIRSLAEDSYGRVWIGTDEGLAVYNSDTEEITQLNITCYPKKETKQIRKILVKDDDIFLVTPGVLIHANIKTQNLDNIAERFHPLNDFLPANRRYDAAIFCKDGRMCVLSEGKLSYTEFEKESAQLTVVDSVLTPYLKTGVHLCEDKFNNIWVATDANGIVRYSPKSKKADLFDKTISNNSIVASIHSHVTTDFDNNLWVSSRDMGLVTLKSSRLNDELPLFEPIVNSVFDEKSLTTNKIFSLYVCRNNILWIGTLGNGINIYDPKQKKFDRFKIPVFKANVNFNTNFTRAVFIDKDENLWMGLHNSGLYIFLKDSVNFKKAGYANNTVFHITNLDKERVLLCTSLGVSVVKMQNFKLKYLSHFSNYPFFYACKGKGDVVWLASVIGVFKARLDNDSLHINERYQVNSKIALSANNTRTLYYCEKRNEIYVGTEGGGLNIMKLDQDQNVISSESYKKSQNPNSISSNFIRTIIEDSNGDFWLGTFEGLNKLLRDPKTGEITFKSFIKKDGLSNNLVQSLVEDNQKQLWIGTIGGLSKLDLKTETFVNYTVSEGLQDNEFTEHCVFKKADGQILMGGINGINMFYPEKITSNNTPPKTTITAFYLFNKKVEISKRKDDKSILSQSIVSTDSLNLEADQNSFGFDFSALLHSTPEKVKYAYKLEGFDKDWNYTTANNRKANYTNLKHGEYNFLVKSTTIDGVWETTPRKLFIHIETPMYLSWIAFVFYFALLVLLFIYFTNFTVIKYTTKKNILLENEHNKKLRDLDELKNRFFINISHDLRTPLTLISSPLELVLKNKDVTTEIKNHLNLVLQNVKKLRHITEQLLDLSKSEAGKLTVKLKNQDIVAFINNEASHFAYAFNTKGIVFKSNSNPEVIYASFDPDMISNVVFNIISNALKYTHKGFIEVRMSTKFESLPELLNKSIHNEFIKIEIQDSGEGIDNQDLEKVFDRFYQGKVKKDKGYGIGLSHCKDLVELHEGAIEVSSELGVGTTFCIYIPKIVKEVSEPQSESSSPKSIKHSDDSINQIITHDFSQQARSDYKILLIEDNFEMRNFIGNELRKEYKVFETFDGLSGLEMADRFLPDIIVSDIMMPNMDGLEMGKKLKTNIKTSHIPIILLSAKIDSKVIVEKIERAGIDDFLAKPFEMDVLNDKIKNILTSRVILRDLFKSNIHATHPFSTVSAIDDGFMTQLIAELEKGIDNPDFSFSTIESILDISHSVLFRKLKYLTGLSSKELLLNMRMQRAKKIILENPAIELQKTATMVGFSNVDGFVESYKDYFGVLPK